MRIMNQVFGIGLLALVACGGEAPAPAKKAEAPAKEAPAAEKEEVHRMAEANKAFAHFRW